jgi:hypothetical protein
MKLSHVISAPSYTSRDDSVLGVFILGVFDAGRTDNNGETGLAASLAHF